MDRKRIRKWRRIQSELQATDSNKKRLEGGGRKPLDVDLEAELSEWVYQCKSTCLPVSSTMIADKARSQFMSRNARRHNLLLLLLLQVKGGP